MTADEVYRRLTRVDKLPTLPSVAAKIGELVEDPKTSAKELNALIAHDPTITSRILRVVNSAYYGVREKISSITHAIVLLGFNVVKQLVISTSVMASFKSRSTPGFDRRKLWVHSIGVATASRMLSGIVRFDRRSQEQFFTAGLLHDIGKLVMENYMNREFGEAIAKARAEKAFLCDVEREFFGVTHAEIGRWLVTHWSFPAELCYPVLYHHRVKECMADENADSRSQRCSAIVHIADLSVHALGIGHSGTPVPPRLEPEALGLLRIGQPQMKLLLDRLKDEGEKIEAFVGSVGPEEKAPAKKP